MRRAGRGPNIQPYGLLVLEKLDRVVTTSAPMLSVKAPTHVIQIWRLSDLKLLQMIDLKPAVHGVAAESADDAAVLDDGTTVIVKTARCGLFALTDVNALAGEDPPAWELMLSNAYG